MRSGVLTSISSRQRSSISGGPLPEGSLDSQSAARQPVTATTYAPASNANYYQIL